MFVHLHVHSPYSFLDGASNIEALVRRAAELGMPALAITDHDSLTAAVKFNACCRQYSIQPIFGVELTMEDRTHLTLLAKSREGYANICSLASLGYQHGGRRSPAVPWESVPRHVEGVVCLSGCRKGRLSRLLLERHYDDALAFGRQLKEWFGGDLFIELQDDLAPHAQSLCRNLALLAKHVDAPTVATNNVHYAEPAGLIAHDVKRCIAAGITIDDVHPDRPFNSERYLKSGREMIALFNWHPEAIASSVRIAELCGGSDIMPLDEYITPLFPAAGGMTSAQLLRQQASCGARNRRGRITPQVQRRIDDELHLIDSLGYTDYLLHADRIVRANRANGIMITGRGSGADSEICYDLGLTDIDPIARRLPVSRWLAPGKKPDIDIDIEDRRRDEVFRWCQAAYGEGHVALCCTYATYWSRGAIRDIGKALALPPETLEWLRKHSSDFMRPSDLREEFMTSSVAGEMMERCRLVIDLAEQIAGHPRHMGSHSSGLVISAVPLAQLNVVTPSARGILPIVALDKDDVEEMGAVKLDILSLPTLAVVKDASDDIRRSRPEFRYEDIPREDTAVYEMLRTGSNMGLFQLGSPAQAALATQLLPNDFEHLVASIGLIRPGPIKAQAVKKYVAAKNGYARISYLHYSLRPILERTYGVCCFQEQVDGIIAAMMGFSDAEASRWRKTLHKHFRANTLDEARREFTAKALTIHRDLTPKSAHLIASEVLSWHGLGFVEGHSASFALTAQKTAHLMRHHPSQYYAALMSNQPCGFYPVQSLAAEVRRRGVRVDPIDINESDIPCATSLNGAAMRLGFCLISGMQEQHRDIILERRSERPYASLLDFCARVPLPKNIIESLILCGAFDSLHDNMRGLMWRLEETLAKASALRSDEGREYRLSLRMPGAMATPMAQVEDLDSFEKMMWQWRITGVTASCHPFAYFREALASRGIVSIHEALQRKTGERVQVAGLNIRPHRPPAKTGGRHLFTTLEDETDYGQAAFYDRSIDRCIATVLLSPIIVVAAVVKRRGLGAGMEVQQAWPLDTSKLRRDEGASRTPITKQLVRRGAHFNR